jgi:hypothetical protein
MIKGVFLIGALLIAFSSAGLALTTANATFGFAPIGTITANNADLLMATTITLPALNIVNTVPPINVVSPNDFFCTGTNTATCVAAGSNVTLNPLTFSLMTGPVSLPNFLVFSSSTTPANRYTFSPTSETVAVNSTTRSVSAFFLGTFHDLSGTFADNGADVSFSFTQAAVSGTVNGSGTFSTPPIPEPTTLTLLASALVAVGLVGRKRFGR